jgi:hypothetical protein
MRTWNQKSGLAILAALACLAPACSKQAFVPITSTTDPQSPGNYFIPPKVDILMAEDDTGSMRQVFDDISEQMPQLLQGLETRGWDYHFAVTPLTTPRSMSQVTASRHDSNWGSEWTPAYPGAPFGGPGTVLASVFRKPGQFTGFLTLGDIRTGDGSEPGLHTIYDALASKQNGTNLVRPDSLLVVLVVGNGEDTSGVTYCKNTWANNPDVPCESSQAVQSDGSCIVSGTTAHVSCSSVRTAESSFQSYKAGIVGSRPLSQVKFYSAVSTATSSRACLGSTAYYGGRYIRMANELGGTSVDVCTQTVSSVLNNVASNLAAVRGTYRTRYLFVAREPEESSIVVTKYVGGVPQVVPHDPVNGWTYEGYLSNVFAIDAPVPMNQSSGWAIELHGTAKLVGDERADVAFQNKGASTGS